MSRVPFFLLVALAVVGVHEADARGSTRTVTHGVQQFLEGDLDGLAIDPLGQLVPAPVRRVDMPTTSLYAWSLALDDRGRLVVGAGDDGRLYRSKGKGDDAELEEFADTLAFEILSLLRVDGGFLAGTSPDAVIYRVDDDGKVDIALDLPQQSVWALVEGSRDGTWIAGTGPGARLIRGGRGSEAGEMLHRLSATNLTALVRDDGGLWIGTQGPGLVLRIEGDDDTAPALRYEAPQDEIAGLVPDGDGGVFVLSTNVTGPENQRGSRIAWVPARGAHEVVWEGSEVLLSIERLDDGSFVAGEAQSGRILRIDLEGRMGLWAELEGGDPLALLVDDRTTYVATGNLGVVYALTPGREEQGTYESPIVPTPHAETFGRLWLSGWGEQARFRTRTGLRATPDETWSDWSDWLGVGSVITSPAGTHLQYQLELEDTTVDAIHLAWAERNLAPTVQRLRVLAAGGDVVAGGGGGSTVLQRFDNGLQVEYAYGAMGERVEPENAAWIRGIRTIVWEGRDPNEDELQYRVDVMRLPDGDWIEVVDEHPERIYAWDSSSVSDGTYRIRVTATDQPVHAPGAGREGSQISGAVRVDNTAPRVADVDVSNDRTRVRVEDSGSPLAEVDARTEGGEWSPLVPVDGVIDAPVEEFDLPEPLRGTRVWIRAVDRAGNVVLHDHRPR